ncbi:unnamed protein product [Caenorhabditis angaria]|uniref:Ground-like domain-containing protein n=1 Tax=Caenorhabditis angaria TaxID=860376 RepID=A0A9P1IUD4_9PELO|nr:unnamed protein product [Caenorhabditis angaria]
MIFAQAPRHRRKQKFVRLPSGYTFPADAASNFQRDTYVAATFAPPPSHQILHSPPRYITPNENEGTQQKPHGMSYTDYKKAMETSTITAPQSASDNPYVEAPPEVGGNSPETPVEMTTTAMIVETVTDSGEGTQMTTAATMGLKKGDIGGVAQSVNNKFGGLSQEKQHQLKANTYTALGGGQFYQSILGGKGGFNPLSLFLGGGANNGGYIVPVPVVIPPPPPPPPGPKCFTNPSGFLCCNVTLEKTMEEAYIQAKAEGVSTCNVQKMASAVQEKAEKKFGTTFESVAAHADFVAKINFAGDLNCKIEIDGKFIMAYATPVGEQDVNIVDANSFFSGAADVDLEGANGTKPTYIVYGPIK